MDNKSDENFIIIQAAIESNKQDMKSNKQYSDEKMMNLTEDFKAMLAEITYQINTLKSSLIQKYFTKPPYLTTVVPSKRRAITLDGGHSIKICAMWILKN